MLVLISLPHKEEEAFPGEKPEEALAEEGKEPELIKKERAAEEPEAEGKGKEKGERERRRGRRNNGCGPSSAWAIPARSTPRPVTTREAGSSRASPASGASSSGGSDTRARTAETERGEDRVLLVLPQTFMNLSGLSVRELVRDRRIEPRNIVIVYDDLDVPLGAIRVRAQGTAGTHNGMQIGRPGDGGDRVPPDPDRHRPPAADADAADYVLSPFSRAEKETLAGALDAARQALVMILDGDIKGAMNEFNNKVPNACPPFPKGGLGGFIGSSGNPPLAPLFQRGEAKLEIFRVLYRMCLCLLAPSRRGRGFISIRRN